MKPALKPIPDIPQQLILDAAAGVLVPFVGAGLSRLAGSPGWAGFADKLLKEIVSKKPDLLSHGDLSLLQANSPRTNISIAMQLMQRHAIEIDFTEILCSPSNEAKAKLCYEALCTFAPRFLTTNYDNWLLGGGWWWMEWGLRSQLLGVRFKV